MPIQFACPKCKRSITVDDRYAGRNTRCPGCTTTVTIPAAPEDDNPFGLGDGPLVTSVGGRAIAAAQPEDEAASAEIARLRQEPGWQSVNAGLKNVWLGTGLQVLGVTTVLLVLGILFTTGSRFLLVMGTERNDWGAIEAADTLAKVGRYSIIGSVGLFVLVGTVLRLLGFVRCFSVPPASGAKGLVIGMFVCELLPVLVMLGGVIDLTGVLDAPVVLPLLAAWTSGLVVGIDLVAGLALMLLFVRRVGFRLGSKELPRRVASYVYWFGGGLVLAVVATVAYFYWLRSLGGRTGGPLPFFGILGVIALDVTVALIILIKYLGVLTLTTDELKKRTGKYWV